MRPSISRLTDDWLCGGSLGHPTGKLAVAHQGTDTSHHLTCLGRVQKGTEGAGETWTGSLPCLCMKCFALAPKCLETLCVFPCVCSYVWTCTHVCTCVSLYDTKCLPLALHPIFWSLDEPRSHLLPRVRAAHLASPVVPRIPPLGLAVACHSHLTFRFRGSELPVCRDFIH